MPVKQPEILSRADFDAAVVMLRLNVSDVAKETNIPRTYLSEFRNGDRKLRPEHQAKLKDFFEGKGVEFDSDDDDESGAPVVTPSSPHPRLGVATVCHFPVRQDIAAENVRAVIDEIDRNDDRIAELLAHKAERQNTLLGEGFAGQTEDDIRELFALLGANYVLIRYLTGLSNPLEQTTGIDTLQSVLTEALRESIERAGLTALLPQAPSEDDADPEEAAA